MRLLIITQKVDRTDQNLGFFHEWIKEFAKYYDEVNVICLYKGMYSLPNNVKIFSLGKENGASRIKYILNLYKYLFTIPFDKIFVHMNQIYVPLVYFFGKPVYLWYVHKQVTLSLHIALHLVKKVFTVSKESFRIQSQKVMIVGHGVDTELFTPKAEGEGIISVGRISRTKSQLEILKTKENTKYIMVGGPITADDEVYEKEIKQYAIDNALNVEFTGPVEPNKVPDLLHKANVFVNTSKTGSVDKAVLEAMASGLNVITTNEAFSFAIPLDELGSKIKENINKPLNLDNREYVVKNHNLFNLIPKLVEQMK